MYAKNTIPREARRLNRALQARSTLRAKRVDFFSLDHVMGPIRIQLQIGRDRRILHDYFLNLGPYFSD